jgi:hypothetical protein
MVFKVGGWYYFKIADHSKDTAPGDEFTLEICGQVEKITGTHVHLIYWRCNSSQGDREAENDNNERAALSLSSILRKKRLII